MSDPTPKPTRRARFSFTQLIIAAIVGGLVATSLPTIAAQVGDALKLGRATPSPSEPPTSVPATQGRFGWSTRPDGLPWVSRRWWGALSFA